VGATHFGIAYTEHLVVGRMVGEIIVRSWKSPRRDRVHGGDWLESANFKNYSNQGGEI